VETRQPQPDKVESARIDLKRESANLAKVEAEIAKVKKAGPNAFKSPVITKVVGPSQTLQEKVTTEYLKPSERGELLDLKIKKFNPSVVKSLKAARGAGLGFVAVGAATLYIENGYAKSVVTTKTASEKALVTEIYNLNAVD
jgi:hypothetical protein